ncbi:MAG: ABC transporter permease [Planctomycetes bacterium]|nr:ABC transporter permease [Planctomycetota bacterium]
MTKSFRLDGIDKDRLLEFWDVRVPPEQLESFLATENGMLVGRRVYEAYRWPLGTTVQLGVLNEAAAVVCGVYDAGGSAIDSRAFAGRTFVQRALNKQGIVHNILAKVDGLQNVDGVIEGIDKGLTLNKKTESISESSMYADLVKELADMRITAALIAAVALLAVFFGIWNAVSMTVRDRIREFGVLRSVGFTRPRIAGLILMEGGAIAFAGGLLALPLILAGVAAFRSLYGELRYMDVVVPVEVDAALLAFSIPVAGGVGVLSSLVPAIGASAKPVVEALRSVE